MKTKTRNLIFMEHTPDDGPLPNTLFDDMVENLEVSHDTTIEAQQELLEAIKQRHNAAQQEAGITLVAIDRLPMEAVGTEPEISLRRLRPSPDIEEMFLRINYSVQQSTQQRPVTKNVFISVAKQRTGEAVTPQKGFDTDQANLVFNQADELTSLQKEGYMPNLSADLSRIFDPRTAMMRAPSQPKP